MSDLGPYRVVRGDKVKPVRVEWRIPTSELYIGGAVLNVADEGEVRGYSIEESRRSTTINIPCRRACRLELIDSVTWGSSYSGTKHVRVTVNGQEYDASRDTRYSVTDMYVFGAVWDVAAPARVTIPVWHRGCQANPFALVRAYEDGSNLSSYGLRFFSEWRRRGCAILAAALRMGVHLWDYSEDHQSRLPGCVPVLPRASLSVSEWLYIDPKGTGRVALVDKWLHDALQAYRRLHYCPAAKSMGTRPHHVQRNKTAKEEYFAFEHRKECALTEYRRSGELRPQDCNCGKPADINWQPVE